MNPRSIAVAGASNDYRKMGTIQTLSILKEGYRGRFYPLHPKEDTVLGHRAYRSAADLPETPDLAVLIVPGPVVPTLMEDFGRRGTRRVIIVTAGFRETGEEGQKREEQIKEMAARYGMRFVGPNCLGVINAEISLNTTVAPFRMKPGHLGFASQSGTYVTQVLPYLRSRGIRFSKALSLGNEADINIIDALEYLGADEHTRAIILYIEGLRDGQRFVEVARRITPHKPVLAKYVGGSESGARAGSSHTGAMAGPDFLYDGIFKQAGIIRVHTIEDLYSHGWTLATQPPLRGRRVAIVTNSGGPGSSIAYTCDQEGLEVPRFSAELQQQIRPLIEAHASAANPVDMTFDLSIDKLSITLPEIIMKSGEVDAVILHGAMHTGFLREIYSQLTDYLGGISFDDFMAFFPAVDPETFSLTKKYALPMVVSTFFDRQDIYTRGYQDNDIPVFFNPEGAARALGSLYRYKLIRERPRAVETSLPPVRQEAVELIEKAVASGRKALDEFEAKVLLALYGVPVTREEKTTKSDEAAAAARRIGYPVSLKACSEEILHKSGKGLIRLDLTGDDEVKEAFAAIRKAAGSDVPVLVQEMVKGDREFLAGMTRFPGFAPCVVFGMGGVLTEIYLDTSLRQAPISDTDATEMFAEIRYRALLGPYRGMAPVNLSSLTGILQAIGTIALLHPEIAEIDVNPLIVRDGEPIAVDALMVIG